MRAFLGIGAGRGGGVSRIVTPYRLLPVDTLERRQGVSLLLPLGLFLLALDLHTYMHTRYLQRHGNDAIHQEVPLCPPSL